MMPDVRNRLLIQGDSIRNKESVFSPWNFLFLSRDVQSIADLEIQVKVSLFMSSLPPYPVPQITQRLYRDQRRHAPEKLTSSTLQYMDMYVLRKDFGRMAKIPFGALILSTGTWTNRWYNHGVY